MTRLASSKVVAKATEPHTPVSSEEAPFIEVDVPEVDPTPTISSSFGAAWGRFSDSWIADVLAILSLFGSIWVFLLIGWALS